MSLSDYNDYLIFPLPDNVNVRQRASDLALPSVRVGVIDGPQDMEYERSWRFHEAATYQAFVAEFEAVRYSRKIEWTPPGGSAAMYRFTNFSTSVSRNFFSVNATLRRFTGVA